MNTHFTIEGFIEECEAVGKMGTIDVDRAADLGPLLEAVRTGAALPPAPQPLVAKAGRTDYSKADPVAKTANDWDEVIHTPAPVVRPDLANYNRHRDMSDEEKKIEDVKDAAYCKLIDAGVSVADARKIVFA